MNDEILDLLVVGAGPTAIAIGAEARQKGLSVLLVDRGPLTAAIQEYPTFLQFFTTRDRLEIAGIPFATPDDKPTRRDAMAYYAAVVARYQVPLALHEEVLEVRKEGETFRVVSRPAAPHASAETRVPGRAPWLSQPATGGTPTGSACRGRTSPGCTSATRSPTRTSGRTW